MRSTGAVAVAKCHGDMQAFGGGPQGGEIVFEDSCCLCGAGTLVGWHQGSIRLDAALCLILAKFCRVDYDRRTLGHRQIAIADMSPYATLEDQERQNEQSRWGDRDHFNRHSQDEL